MLLTPPFTPSMLRACTTTLCKTALSCQSRPLAAQEVTGLRNQYLDTFLPPRRKQGRKAAEQQQSAANGSGDGQPGKPRIKLQFLHFPVTDLSIPTADQCVPHGGNHLAGCCRRAPPRPSVGQEPPGMQAEVRQPACRVRAVTGEVERQLGQGCKVYLHCWGGRGRAGTFGACLLAAMYGMQPEEALLRVQRAFATRGDGGADLPLR